MSTKNLVMGYCFLYALARFGATTVEYFAGSELQPAVMIVAETVSLIGLIFSGFWFAGKLSAGAIRVLLALYSTAAITNILLTRANPINTGATGLDLLVIGTIFDVVLFVAVLILPLPDRPRRTKAPAQQTS